MGGFCLYESEGRHLTSRTGYEGFHARERLAQPQTDWAQRATHRNKSRVRAKVEHPFAIIKRQTGFNQVNYLRIGEEHASALVVACALGNLVIEMRALLKRKRLHLMHRYS